MVRRERHILHLGRRLVLAHGFVAGALRDCPRLTAYIAGRALSIGGTRKLDRDGRRRRYPGNLLGFSGTWRGQVWVFCFHDLRRT